MIDFLLTACINKFDLILSSILFLVFSIGFLLGLIWGLRIVGGKK